MSFPATPLRPDQSPEVIRLLQEVQGNVLSPHALDFSVHLFFAVTAGKEASVRGWLRGLADAGRITSMAAQLAPPPPAPATRPPFVSVMVSHPGAVKLGWGQGAIFPPEFQIGMHAREPRLVIDAQDAGVSGVANWERPYRTTLSPRIELHVMVASDQETETKTVADELQAAAVAAGAAFLGRESGYVARDPSSNLAIEHFGFADGISNPQFMADDVERARKYAGQYWNPLFPLSLALVPVTGGDGRASYGSFFVFRKIEQDVYAFKEFERRVAKAPATAAIAEAGVYLVGRRRDGTPLAIQGAPGGQFNDFTYRGDSQGRRCPFHAHVRKTNPRRMVTEDNDNARDHLFPRRGMVYGAREKDFSDEPRSGVGLLFMAYMASIDRQFEHVLRNWMNNPAFPGREQPGTDSLMGEAPPAEAYVPLSSRRDADVKLSRFVTTRGGEYFFVPPLSWFRSLPTP